MFKILVLYKLSGKISSPACQLSQKSLKCSRVLKSQVFKYSRIKTDLAPLLSEVSQRKSELLSFENSINSRKSELENYQQQIENWCQLG